MTDTLTRSIARAWLGSAVAAAFCGPAAAGLGACANDITAAHQTTSSSDTSSAGSAGSSSTSSQLSTATGSTGATATNTGATSASGFTGSGSGSSSGSSSTATSSTGGGHPSSSSASGSTSGAPLCSDCRQAACPCGGEAPFCNQSTGLCLSCRSNADCTALGARSCKVDTGVCVACQLDSDCTANPLRPHCGPDNSCQSCSADDQCAALQAGTPFCGTDPTAALYGECWSCTASAQCALGNVCDPIHGQCISDCRFGAACPNSLSCNQLTGLCAQGGCNIDQDCVGTVQGFDGGATPLCDPVYGRCVACLSDVKCAAGEHCQTNPLALNYGGCQPCVGSGQGQCDTANGWLCEPNGRCEQDCRLDAGYAVCGWGIQGEMAGFPACLSSSGLCGQCAQSADCALLAVVLAQPVPPLCDLNSSSCVSCRGPDDCGFDHAGCIPSQGCGQCRRDSDCPNGQVCHDTPGFPANAGGPQYCFCKDDSSCSGGTCVVGGSGFNYNPYNLTAGAYAGFTGQCYCGADGGTACPAGSTCTSVLGGNVNTSNNPGQCLGAGGVIE